MTIIAPEMTIAEVLRQKPGADQILRQFGMHCLGCSISAGETLAEAAEAHGIDLKELLEVLNK